MQKHDPPVSYTIPLTMNYNGQKVRDLFHSLQSGLAKAHMFEQTHGGNTNTTVSNYDLNKDQNIWIIHLLGQGTFTGQVSLTPFLYTWEVSLGLLSFKG